MTGFIAGNPEHLCDDAKLASEMIVASRAEILFKYHEQRSHDDWCKPIEEVA